MTQVGEESGALEEHESKIIKNLLEFEKLSVRDIMTPKTVLIMGRETELLKDYYNENTPIRFSRIPIFRETRDDVTGIMLKDDLLQKLVEAKGDMPLKDIKREVSFVQDDMPLPDLFDHFTTKRDHLSLVVDNYGSVVGLVTMEDLFETLLGQEIMDEMDEVADLQKLARRKWEERFKKKGE
jgi:CBS domain containing-hemolysin-like protein